MYGIADLIPEFTKNVQCPLLMIDVSDDENQKLMERNMKIKWHLLFQSTGSPHSAHYEDELVREILKIYKSNPQFESCQVEGSHFVHINEPHTLVPHLKKFIDKYFN